MIGSRDTENESENDNGSKTQNHIKPFMKSLTDFYHKIFSRKPVYLIKNDGVVVEYYDITKPKTLPFDLDTYRKTQIFIGDYSNPWYVDIEKMRDEYPDFTKSQINEIDDIFGTQYIYPSQRWKLLANQNVLEQMFLKSSVNTEQIQKLLYAVLGGIALVAGILIFA